MGLAAYRLFMKAWVLDSTRGQALRRWHESVHIQAPQRNARQRSVTSALTGCDRDAIGLVAPIAAGPHNSEKRKAV